ncbi:Protein BZZ1, partial [Spiromyces aspiralis]
MFGSQLTPQEVGSVNGHVEAGSELFKLLRGIIEQRVQIEQEYGKKLEALVKKSKTDLQKLSEDHQLARDLDLDFVRQSDYSVIDREEPLVPPSVADHIPTVVQALGVWLKQMWDEAQNRRLLAADFKSEIADKAVLNSKFLDGLRDENIKCYRTMLSKRDAAYERKDKARGEYETIKGDLEKSKDKQLRAENEKKQSQYQRKAESQASQRDRMKNDYILSVRMANAVKHCTEGQAFPMIMDNMYNINRAQINNLQALMLNAARRQAELGQYLGTRLEEMMQCLGAVRAEHDIQAWINERISSG